MTDQDTMRSQPASANARRSRLPFILTLLVCCAAAFGVYLWGRGDDSVRRVSLALVTWNNDAFWDPVIRGAEDAAQEWNVNLTTISSTPEVETQSRHVRDLLAKGIDGIAISPNNPQAQASL